MTFRTVVLGTLASLLVLCTAVATDGSSELAPLQERLRMGKDKNYIAAREEALAMEPHEFSDLLGLLRLDPDDWLGNLLAEMIECRKEHPELAAEFDQRRDEALAHPTPIIKPERGPGYRPTLPEESNEVDILIFESIFKIDSPLSLKNGYIQLLGQEGRGSKEAISPLLQLLDLNNDYTWRFAAMTLGRLARDYPDERIAARFVHFYREVRLHEIDGKPGSFRSAQTVCWAVGRITNESGLRCVLALIGVEAELASEHGFKPWTMDQEAVQSEFQETVLRLAKMRAVAARSDDQHNDVAIQDLLQKRDHLRQRLAWRFIWDKLQQAMKKIVSGIEEQD